MYTETNELTITDQVEKSTNTTLNTTKAAKADQKQTRYVRIDSTKKPRPPAKLQKTSSGKQANQPKPKTKVTQVLERR